MKQKTKERFRALIIIELACFIVSIIAMPSLMSEPQFKSEPYLICLLVIFLLLNIISSICSTIILIVLPEIRDIYL